MLEEIYKIFHENNGSFYFSYTFDLTNTIERQHNETYNYDLPIWKRCDDRFFWNYPLISDLIQLKPECDKNFILPIIQGFIQSEFVNIDMKCVYNKKSVNSNNNNSDDSITSDNSESSLLHYKSLKLCLISRRSRFRLGTRFKKRGIDEDGNVANFVETEQIVEVFNGHLLSFVILRGSIPVYWSQPGFKYRPAPRIDRSFSENKIAFRNHFKQLDTYYPHQNQKILVNLVEEYGKESILADAYLEHVVSLNQIGITYIQFDFHEHCKGLKFENVSRLISRTENIINDMLYCWIDKRGLICHQKSVFRVNCVDCLDRTNVVQMVISKHVLEHQLRKLGLIGPGVLLSQDLKRVFSLMWANNGDAISHQYAGTGALKGDYTRTGERNFAGIMKDGVKSANRFYLRFKENYRQMACDILQGIRLSEIINEDSVINLNLNQNNNNSTSSTSLNKQPLLNIDGDESQAIREENIKQLVADCRKQLIDGSEDCYGSWALINCADYDPTQTDPDIILLFTGLAIYVSNYDEAIEQLIDYQKIPIENIEKIEIGPESSLFKSTRFDILRIHYRIGEESGYFHSFKASCFRFFNNLVITMKSGEEETESLRGIAQTIKYTAMHFNFEIPLIEETKLARKKSKVPRDIISLSKKMSIVASDEQTSPNLQTNSTISKINSVSKLVGNKLLDFSRKMRIPSPLPLNLSDNTNDIQLKSKQQQLKSSMKHSSSTSSLRDNTNNTNNLIDFSSEIQKNKVPINNDNDNLIDFDLPDSKTQTANLLDLDFPINESKPIENDNLSSDLVSFDAMSSINSETASIATTEIMTNNSIDDTNNSNSSSTYIPILTKKQFLNKQLKLNYIRDFTKDSNTSFIFIS